jgi:hypothetical protein
MRYKIHYRGGSQFAEAGWLSDACDIVRGLSCLGPMWFDITDTVLNITYLHADILKRYERKKGT